MKYCRCRIGAPTHVSQMTGRVGGRALHAQKSIKDGRIKTKLKGLSPVQYRTQAFST